jgi:hypothetical protein
MKSSIFFIVIVIALLISITNSLKFESIVIDYINAQNGNYTETEHTNSPPNDKESPNNLVILTTNESSTLLVTKVIKCVSELGIPSDEAVCKFVLDNVDPSQFIITVTGINSNPVVIQGSVNGTSIPLNPGKYVVSESFYDTRNIENLLGETTTGSSSTTALGDCNGQFNDLGNFQNATGTIDSADNQKCEIINTIEITAGVKPE